MDLDLGYWMAWIYIWDTGLYVSRYIWLVGVDLDLGHYEVWIWDNV